MKRRPDRQAGQNTTETVVLLPFFLLMAFGLLQLGQLATGLLVSNYAASAIARQVVQDQTRSTSLGGSYMSRFQDLMTAGMKHGELSAVYTPDGPLLYNVTVHACAEISAFPFIGQFFSRPLAETLGRGSPSQCQGLGAFAINPSPFSFVVHGKATARMNYQPQ